MFERILVAITEAADAEATLAVAKGLAQAFSAEVTVYHARERVVGSHGVDREEESIERAGDYGEEIADRLEAAGVKARVIVESIRPELLAEHILAQARGADAKLIVIGGHHAHNLRESLFGDMGKVLAHRSVCPVLYMPSPPQ